VVVDAMSIAALNWSGVMDIYIAREFFIWSERMILLQPVVS
jgi:hypothetical protein